jgi:hypothetical protein
MSSAKTNMDARGTLLSFRERFGSVYAVEDTDLPECILATYVMNQLDTDQVWLLAVGSPSGGKTASLSILDDLPHTISVSTLSQGSLLSGSPKREKGPDSTGGILRELGESGTIICKDVTSILSMNRDNQAATLAALREIYDGSWTRTFGTDGGKKETWRGRVAVIGAVTQKIDQSHEVMALMGERFLLLRLHTDDELSLRMTRKALDDGPGEKVARVSLARLAKAIVGLVNFQGDIEALPRQMKDNLTTLANLVSQCRSGIERDGRTREIEGVPFREEGPRLARQLASLYRGLLLIGNTEQEAWEKVRRVGLDSMPELRRRAIQSLQGCNGPEKTSVIAKSCNCPTTTTRRALEDMAYLGLLHWTGSEYHEAETWELIEKTKEALEAISFDLADDEPPFDVQGIVGTEISPEIGISSASITPAHTGSDSRVSSQKAKRCSVKVPVDKPCSMDGDMYAASQQA